MIVTACLLLALGQAPAVAAPEEQAAPAAEPYAGPVHEGLAELRARSSARDDEEALELAGALLAAPAFEELAERARARVLFDIGVARARAEQSATALEAFRSAAALAGPGELRLDAAYDGATALLEEAERLREDVPEIAEKLGLPAPPMPPPGPGAEDAGPDPLDLARRAYAAARAELLERLRLDWKGEDTRANLELCLRRLRELEEIEQQREEEEEQQQDDSQEDQEQDENEDQQDQGEDQSQDQEPPESDPEQDQDQKQDEEQDEEQDEQPPEDSEQPEEPEDEDPGEDENQDQEQPEPPDPSEQEEDPESQPEPAREEERVLSREEVQRLLDQLEEIEEQAAAVRAMLRDRRRKPVEKDW